MKENELSKVELNQRCSFGSRFLGADLSKTGLESECVHCIQGLYKLLKGIPGSGKTHIVSAMVDLLLDLFGTYRNWSEEHLSDVMFQLLRKGKNLESIFNDTLKSGVIILDAIGGSGKFDPWKQLMISEAIDWLILTEQPTIITTHLSKEEFCERYLEKTTHVLFNCSGSIQMPNINRRAHGKD